MLSNMILTIAIALFLFYTAFTAFGGMNYLKNKYQDIKHFFSSINPMTYFTLGLIGAIIVLLVV